MEILRRCRSREPLTMPARTTVADQPRWIRALRWLQVGIADGTLSGRLPSEPELAQRLGISYMTMRRAVGELVNEGVLERRQGSGTFVCEVNGGVRPAVGFCIHDNVHRGLANPFYAVVVQSAVEEARRHGHGVITLAGDFPSFFAGPSRTPLCGIIGLAIPPERIAEAAAAARRVPVVLVDSASIPTGAAGVSADDVQVAQLAAEHLLSLGHRRIAYLAGTVGSLVTRTRVTAFLDRLRAGGVAVDHLQVIHGDYEFDSGHVGAGRLLAQRHRPTAIFCANDTVAFGVLRRAAELGLRVPHDLSVLGCGGLEQAELMPVALTTISIPQDQLGWTAWHQLQHLLDGEAPGPLAMVATRLQSGSTTAPPVG